MAAAKLVVLFMFLAALTVSHIRAEVSVEVDEPVKVEDSDSSTSKIELDQLKSKIQTLESHINEKSQELEQKNRIISEKEKTIQDSSARISSLQNEISSLQEKRKLDAKEQVGKAHARAGELEKQVEKLKGEFEEQNKEKVTLETRIKEAKTKIHDLTSKIEDLQKINEGQKNRIQKTERALKVIEEEMIKAKTEVASRTRELAEAHGAWLPPWLASHLIQCQLFVETQWAKHGKPAWETVVQKTLETKAQAGKWAEPHVKTIKTKYVPAAKKQWSVVKANVEPKIKSLTDKTIGVYKSSKAAVEPHVKRMHEFVDPYFEEVKRVSKPYVDQIAVAVKPHADKARVAMKPYTKKAVRSYRKFLKSATTYHHQVQATVRETLKKHKLTKALATKELEWFAASALLALPIFILARGFSSIFCKKAKRPVRNAHSSHARRKAKRSHPEK